MTLNIEKGFGVGHSAETFSNWDSFWFPFQPLLSSWCDLWVSSAIVSLVTASHYVLRQRIQVLYAFKRILKKNSKLTVTSKHRSWEGDWNLERKDCSSCPTLSTLVFGRHCLREAWPLSHTSQSFVLIFVILPDQSNKPLIAHRKQIYWWQRWRQWWRWCGWGFCHCCSPFAAGNHVWRGSYCGLWWASPFCSMFLLILTLLNKIITFLSSVLLVAMSWTLDPMVRI